MSRTSGNGPGLHVPRTGFEERGENGEEDEDVFTAASKASLPAPVKSTLFAGLNKMRKTEKDAQTQEHGKFNDQWTGRMAKNPFFEYTTLMVIVLNAGFIGYATDTAARVSIPDNLYDGPLVFIVFENFFCTYFTFEVTIRFFAFKACKLAATDSWFVFDSFLVAFMVAETWLLPVVGGASFLGQFSVLRLLRLLRITRMARLMRSMPELMTLTKGMVAAMRSVSFVFVFLFLITWTFAILFNSQFHQGDISDDECGELYGAESARCLFGTMGKSIVALFVMGTILDDVTLCTDALWRDNGTTGYVYIAFFLLFVIFASFTVLNMLVGILVEVVQATAEGEHAKNQEQSINDAIKCIFAEMDKDGSGKITRAEFMNMCSDHRIQECLADLGIREESFKRYASWLYRPQVETGEVAHLDFKTLCKMLKTLQPGICVPAIDFASFRHKKALTRERLKQRILDAERSLVQATGGALPELASPNHKHRTSSDWRATAFTASASRSTTAGLAAEAEEPARSSEAPVSLFKLPEDVLRQRLNVTDSLDIISELQRRLGATDVEAADLPLDMFCSEVRQKIQASAAVPPDQGDLGVDDVWAEEVLTC